ncbi:MAG: DUF6166 domain-containing protein [Candidatus Methylomirabilales bacterium]
MWFRGRRNSNGEALVEIRKQDRREPFPRIPIPRDRARFSPTGYEFGYGGSGPAELARAMLVTALPGVPLAWEPRFY